MDPLSTVSIAGIAGSHARWYRSRAMWTAGVVAITEPSATGGEGRHPGRCPFEDGVAVSDEQGLERERAELPDGRECLAHVVGELRIGVADLATAGRQRVTRDKDPTSLVEHRHVPERVARGSHADPSEER